MKRGLLILGLLLAGTVFSGCQEATELPEMKQYTIEQFMNTTSILGSSISTDDNLILFSSNETGIYNAYTVPVRGGKPTRVTDSEENSVFAYSFFPHDNRILYRSDRGGNEIWHIFLRDEDGTVRDLTPEEKARALFYGWSYDGKSFFYGSNKRNTQFMDLYEMDTETFTPRMIYQNDAGYNFSAISNDKRYVAFSKAISTHDSDMFLYDTKSLQLKHLSPHEGDVNYSPVAFSADSRRLYYLTDEGREFTYLKSYDIASGQSETVEQDDWDIISAYFSRSGRYRVTAINHDAKTEIKVYDMVNDQLVELPELADGDITSVNISRSEKLMTFYLSGSRSPNNLYVYDFESKRSKKLTETMNPEIDSDDLVDAEVVRYTSFDGVEIPAILYKPHQATPESKVPALVWVHGGPGGQSRIGYRPLIQYLVNHGYVVMAVNNRGSSGYGKTFYKLDDMKHGEDDLDDCVAAKRFLGATGIVDEAKIGIIGGSYGGYMVLAALTFRPDEFAVGVDLFGISNWVRTLKSIPPWWEAFKDSLYKEIGNPETDEEYLRRISPLFHADQISNPLMVLQGANDPRVIQVESDEIVEAVKKNGVPVEYIIFNDEGHGFVKKKNQIKGYRAILEFLDKYVKGETGS